MTQIETSIGKRDSVPATLTDIINRRYPLLTLGNSASLLEDYRNWKIDGCCIRVEDVYSPFGRNFLDYAISRCRKAKKGEPAYCEHGIREHNNFFEVLKILQARIRSGEFLLQSQDTGNKKGLPEQRFILTPNNYFSDRNIPYVVFEGLSTIANIEMQQLVLPTPSDKRRFFGLITTKIITAKRSNRAILFS